MPKRSLPPAASAALEIIVGSGSREIRAHDLELRMHQRGFSSRGVTDALRAFERRNWLVQVGRTVEISESAIEARSFVKKRARPKAVRQPRLPVGLFS